MMENRSFTCKNCGIESNIIGIEQNEINYYSFYLDTNQMEDYGEGECKSQALFCLKCENKVKKGEFEL